MVHVELPRPARRVHDEVVDCDRVGHIRPVAPPLHDTHVLKDVVLYQDPIGGARLALADNIVVAGQDPHAALDVADRVQPERDVLNERPWRTALLIADSEHNRIELTVTRDGVAPRVLKNIAFDEDAASVFEL